MRLKRYLVMAHNMNRDVTFSSILVGRYWTLAQAAKAATRAHRRLAPQWWVSWGRGYKVKDL
jgi:hypothetical protein